jgi:hypothetical protein
MEALMDVDLLKWAITQGGWAALALIMFLVHRRDTAQYAVDLQKLEQAQQARIIDLVRESHEQVEMFLRFGQERGKLEQHIADTLDEIKIYLGKVQLCPVTMLSQDDIKELARVDPSITRAKAAQLIREHLKNTEK